MNLEQIIREIIRKGNQVEVKREKDNIVVVEIRRKAVVKIPLYGKEVKRDS